MNLGNLRVSTRLLIGFGLVLTFMVVLLAQSMFNMSKIQGRMDDITQVYDVESKLASAMYLTVTERALALRNLILLHDVAEIDIENNRIGAQTRRYHELEAQLGTMLAKNDRSEAALLDLFEQIKKQAVLSEPFIARGQQLRRENQLEEAYRVLRFEFRPVQKKWWDLLKEFGKRNDLQTQEAMQGARIAYEDARQWTILFGTLALVIGLTAATMITRSLLHQLGGEPTDAARIANEIANGNLAAGIHLQANDQSSLMHAMKEMRDGLAQIVGKVRSGSDMIATASRQIASGNMDLSARTETQAASLEETSSSMSELTSTVRKNFHDAERANELAHTASSIAQQGGEAVNKVVNKMAAINDASRKIVDIIAVIDSIAFQTNILALNAAVEAARAGEQGKGFAVVASEVRSLAQRSANAAKEIKHLIDHSVSCVGEGTSMVQHAGGTMERIVEAIQSVKDIMDSIMVAGNDQARGIEQVGAAIRSMDEVTQQNAALVEEAAAAASSLQEQAQLLAETVSMFTLNEDAVVPQTVMPANIPKENIVTIVKKAAANAPLMEIKRLANSKARPDQDWDEF